MTPFWTGGDIGILSVAMTRFVLHLGAISVYFAASTVCYSVLQFDPGPHLAKVLTLGFADTIVCDEIPSRPSSFASRNYPSHISRHGFGNRLLFRICTARFSHR